MKTRTGITLLATGAILTFAVNVHPSFISPQIVGLVLMLTGLTGFCLNQRGTGLLDRQLAMLRYLLGRDASMVSGRRVPLDDLLSDALRGDNPVRENPVRDNLLGSGDAEALLWRSSCESPRPAPYQSLRGDVAVDDTPTSPDIWAGSVLPEGIGAGQG